VAVFGALVGTTPLQIVRGLQIASLTSVGLVLIATVVAWKRIRRIEEFSAREGEIEFQIE
jgi:hypothetical protein